MSSSLGHRLTGHPLEASRWPSQGTSHPAQTALYRPRQRLRQQLSACLAVTAGVFRSDRFLLQAPVLFEREGLQRVGLDRQFRESDDGGRHGYHDAQLAPRLQDRESVVSAQATASSAHARHHDGVMRFACRDLNAFEPGVELGEREAALRER